MKSTVDYQTPEAFVPRKEQKGLSEGIWLDYLPEPKKGGGIIIDLGCGWNKLVSPKKGYRVLGVDHNISKSIDIRCDLNGKIPLADNSIDAVFSSHCIEHLRDKDRVFCEIHRILKMGGIAFIKVPHFRSVQAENYDHLSRWASFSMSTFANAKWYSSNFPYFEIIRIGIKWRVKRRLIGHFVDWLINKSLNLSETWCWFPLGGFDECQYLIRKPEG